MEDNEPAKVPQGRPRWSLEGSPGSRADGLGAWSFEQMKNKSKIKLAAKSRDEVEDPRCNVQNAMSKQKQGNGAHCTYTML